MVLGIVEAPAFDKFILVIILLNSVCMAVTNHRNPDAPINGYINVLEYIFLAIFIVECVLKIIAYGFFVGKTSLHYLERSKVLKLNGWACRSLKS